MEKLVILVVIVASVKFLFEGGSLTVFGTADAMSYGLFLSPVLGAHGYMHIKKPKIDKVDNPDGQ